MYLLLTFWKEAKILNFEDSDSAGLNRTLTLIMTQSATQTTVDDIPRCEELLS